MQKPIQDFRHIPVTHTKVALPLIRVLTCLSWIKANFVYLLLMCMEADSNTASASLRLSKCQDEELQKFEWDNNGRIYLISNMKLCLTVAQGKSRKGGGGSPTHLLRNLSLELCGDSLQAFQMWGARSER